MRQLNYLAALQEIGVAAQFKVEGQLTITILGMASSRESQSIQLATGYGPRVLHNSERSDSLTNYVLQRNAAKFSFGSK